MILEIITTTIGILGLTAAACFYWELRKWVRLCHQARIGIFYKQRSRLQAPLVEWVKWAQQLSKDEASTGRTVYVMKDHAIAIYFGSKHQPKVQAVQSGPAHGAAVAAANGAKVVDRSA
jgi:hypothetical protein